MKKKKTTEYMGGHVGTMVGDSSIVVVVLRASKRHSTGV